MSKSISNFINKNVQSLQLSPVIVEQSRFFESSFYDNETPAIHVRLSAPDQKKMALHEIGHHFLAEEWGKRVSPAKFKKLFGNINKDYDTSSWLFIARYLPATKDGFVSLYAQYHPEEDWAETFADVMLEGGPCDYDDDLLNEKAEFVWDCIQKPKGSRKRA
jgi:hypothetical protein